MFLEDMWVLMFTCISLPMPRCIYISLFKTIQNSGTILFLLRLYGYCTTWQELNINFSLCLVHSLGFWFSLNHIVPYKPIGFKIIPFQIPVMHNVLVFSHCYSLPSVCIWIYWLLVSFLASLHKCLGLGWCKSFRESRDYLKVLFSWSL